MNIDVVQVRMQNTRDDAVALLEVLDRAPADVRAIVRDQIWLKTTLLEHRRQVPIAERDRFNARCDQLLARLDPQEEQ